MKIVTDEVKDAMLWVCLGGHSGEYAYGAPAETVTHKEMQGVVVPPIQYYYGLHIWGNAGVAKVKDEDDIDIYTFEARKFLWECMKGNYKAIELLFLAPEHYTVRTPAGDLMIKNRDMFITSALNESLAKGLHAVTALHKQRSEEYTKGLLIGKAEEVWREYSYEPTLLAESYRLLNAIDEVWQSRTYTIYKAPGWEVVQQIRTGQIKGAEIHQEFNHRLKDTFDKLGLPLTQERLLKYQNPPLEKVSELARQVVETHYASLNARVRAVHEMQPISNIYQ